MTYTINGKTYIQKPLVLGQIKPLITLLKDKTFDDLTPFAVISAMDEVLPRCMALILIPEGSSVKDRDLDAIELEFYEYMDIEMAMQIASDFFLCNPPSSLLSQFRQIMTGVREQFRKIGDSIKS